MCFRTCSKTNLRSCSKRTRGVPATMCFFTVPYECRPAFPAFPDRPMEGTGTGRPGGHPLSPRPGYPMQHGGDRFLKEPDVRGSHKMKRRHECHAAHLRSALTERTMEFLNMSMPSYPPCGADMTREEALTMIIASIAMEELALSHILNAEGEKLQYILGTLPGSTPCACPQDVLAVNKSITALIEAVTQNQMLLKNKLDRVLEFCSPPCPPCGPEPCPPSCPPCSPEPCPPSCPPCRPTPCPPPCGPEPCPPSGKVPACQQSALQLTARKAGALWKPGCPISWKQCSRIGNSIHLDEHTTTQIRLAPRKTYMIHYTLNVCAAPTAEGSGAILLKQSPRNTFTNTPPLRFSVDHLAHGTQTLCGFTLLYPYVRSSSDAELSLILDSQYPLCVESAVFDALEL